MASNYTSFEDVITSNITSQKQDVMLELHNRRYAAALLPITFILAVFSVTGVLGNILVFFVYGANWNMKDKKLRLYILSLAIIDFITCVTLIPAEIWKHQAYFTFEKTEICKTKCFLNVFAASAASYCLMLIALDRYILTCHPLLFVRLRSFSYNTAWRLCLLMVVLGLLTSLPAALFCGTARQPMANSDGVLVSVYLCDAEPSYKKSYGRYAYRMVLCVLLLTVAVLLIVLYALIGRAVRRVMRKRSCSYVLRGTITEADMSMNETCPYCHNSHSQLPLSLKLLFAVTLVYVLTHVIYVALSWADQTKMSPVQFAVFSVFFRLYFVHSMINPLLYLKMDKHFRKRVVKLFHLFLCRSSN